MQAGASQHPGRVVVGAIPCDAERTPVGGGDALRQLVRDPLGFQRIQAGVCVVERTEIEPVISKTHGQLDRRLVNGVLVLRSGMVDGPITLGQWNVELDAIQGSEVRAVSGGQKTVSVIIEQETCTTDWEDPARARVGGRHTVVIAADASRSVKLTLNPGDDLLDRKPVRSGPRVG